MCGSGLRTAGTKIILGHRRMAQPGRKRAKATVANASCEAVHGSIQQGHCVPRTGSGPHPRTETTTLASVSPRTLRLNPHQFGLSFAAPHDASDARLTTTHKPPRLSLSTPGLELNYEGACTQTAIHRSPCTPMQETHQRVHRDHAVCYRRKTR